MSEHQLEFGEWIAVVVWWLKSSSNVVGKLQFEFREKIVCVNSRSSVINEAQ